MLPRLAVTRRNARLVALTLRNPGVSRTLGVISRRGHPLSPAATALRGLIERRIRQEAGRDSAKGKSGRKPAAAEA